MNIMDPSRDHSHDKIFVILFFIFINLLLLDLWEVMRIKNNPSLVSSIQPTAVIINLSPTPDLSCPKSCTLQINEATASIKLAAPVITIVQNTQSSQASSQVKEFFVPIGSGTNSSDDWEDVPGLRVNVDSNQYGKIKSVVFEATVRVPTLDQSANVRLYNVTDKHTVLSSELNFIIGSQPTLLTSQPITLDPGVKTYQVQMKTQLKHPGFLDQSRIHIITY